MAEGQEGPDNIAQTESGSLRGKRGDEGSHLHRPGAPAAAALPTPTQTVIALGFGGTGGRDKQESGSMTTERVTGGVHRLWEGTYRGGDCVLEGSERSRLWLLTSGTEV